MGSAIIFSGEFDPSPNDPARQEVIVESLFDSVDGIVVELRFNIFSCGFAAQFYLGTSTAKAIGGALLSASSERIRIAGDVVLGPGCSERPQALRHMIPEVWIIQVPETAHRDVLLDFRSHVVQMVLPERQARDLGVLLRDIDSRNFLAAGGVS